MMEQSAAAVSNSIHPLLKAPAEAVHQLSDEGGARVEDDPELAPGHDACAVCAGPLDDSPTACALCESVRYCSPQHLIDDAPSHAAVCSALRCMRHADCLTDHAQNATAEGNTATATSEEGGAQSQAQRQAASAQSVLEYRPPERSRDGWQHVVPDKYRHVYPGLEAQPDEGGEQPARKRARKLDSSGEATTSQGGTGRAAPKGAAASGSAAASGQADDEDQLQLAAELAARTAVLSYAYTAAYALKSVPAARGAARRAESDNRPLELVVLGAAGDAELGELPSWQVVAAALDQDVRIQFVGPEVPNHLAGTEAQLGRVAMRFHQCTYEQVAAGGPQGSQPGGAPDVYFAFNPGFTCPDYEWSETVKRLARAARSPGAGRSSDAAPRACLVVATNTSMEAQMEADWLEEYRWHAEAPAAPNPYTSLKLHQSGTLANDLYRKNAWLVVYEHRDAHARSGRSGRRGAKAAAKRAAKALYNAVVSPVARLLRKR